MDELNTNSRENLETAVLFIVFNRPDTTETVFDAIRKTRPSRLYIASDGPRAERDGEASRVMQVRKLVTRIDWPCELKTLFRDKNAGCKYAVSEAINWFFSHEDKGIILEDDCLPSSEFFYFAQDMLIRYEDDPRVMMITGTNYLSGKTGLPYYFSEHFTIWGWATWRRAWANYDVDMRLWSDKRPQLELKEKFSNWWIRKHYELTFNSLNQDYRDTWDIQWVFTGLINRCLCITPGTNQISNIGIQGTHGDTQSGTHFLPIDPINLQSYNEYNPEVRQDLETDIEVHRIYNIPAVKKKLIKLYLKKLKIYSIFAALYKALNR